MPHTGLPRHVRLAAVLDHVGDAARESGCTVEQCVGLCRQAALDSAAGQLDVQVDAGTQRVRRVAPVEEGAGGGGRPRRPRPPPSSRRPDGHN